MHANITRIAGVQMLKNKNERAFSSTRTPFFSLYIPHTTRSFCPPEKASLHFTRVL
jgi:hypothetical protein